MVGRKSGRRLVKRRGVQVAGVELMIIGPHDPVTITGKTDYKARHRERVQREGNRTVVGEILHEATLGPLFCLDDRP